MRKRYCTKAHFDARGDDEQEESDNEREKESVREKDKNNKTGKTGT